MKRELTTTAGNKVAVEIRYNWKEHNVDYMFTVNGKLAKGVVCGNGFKIYSGETTGNVYAPEIAKEFIDEEKRMCNADAKRLAIVEEIEADAHRYDASAVNFE